MFANFTNAVKGKGGSGKADYSLNEILAILDMVNNEISKEEIVKITGRSKDSLNYKIFEGQTTINGKTNVRSIKRHWFVDPTVRGSALKPTEEALRSLYAAHGEVYTDEAEVQARIDAYAAARESAAS